MIYLLLRPWSYLTIYPRQKEKQSIDVYFPLILAFISAGLIWYITGNSVLLPQKDSLVITLANFFQTLPGFYLAALSAIATFNQPDMDKAMTGLDLKIKILYNNHLTEIYLSRRRFLCVMFAFLTVQSFVFTIASLFITSVTTPQLPCLLTKLGAFLINWILYFIFWQLVMITLWSLYYLGERIHTPDP